MAKHPTSLGRGIHAVTVSLEVLSVYVRFLTGKGSTL